MDVVKVKPTHCARCGLEIAQKRTGRSRKYCPPCGQVVFRAQRDAWDDMYRPGRRKTNNKGANHAR
jgi:predicted RNA-binding Zn-ribbon protein involved in translation (DUF1610 family)